tara:strand:- start:117 stop:644 length:528 start_codon:yes stop_codon:yes gene_type:complete
MTNLENNKVEENKTNDKTVSSCSPCFYTSILFLIVAFKAIYNNYIPYGLLWLQLSFTSILYHGKMYSESYKDYLLSYDRASAYLVVLYGAYLLLHKITCFSDNNNKNNKKYKKFSICDFLTVIVIIISFMITIYLYHYGYQISKYCFDDNKETAHFYHMILHLLSIIGHLLIILL